VVSKEYVKLDPEFIHEISGSGDDGRYEHFQEGKFRIFTMFYFPNKPTVLNIVTAGDGYTIQTPFEGIS
jgi:hypothetical protein